ncbi:hypothetical protein HDU91_004126 [Kappamyces sp. JEL0680]|nr:hypothetical protein HDU91_004126 [Kappamyces sp. JEL0680]
MFEFLPDAVDQKGLQGLAKYKYSAVDKSPISKYILQPYWSWAATLFPIWMAPNLITLLGFLFVLANFLLLLHYTPDLSTPAPGWVYISFGVGLWVYSTFDNVDGKQARRTGTSSPLGELFDHGVDALNCTTGGLLQAAGICLGLTHWSILTVAVASTAFFFATWETYYTGTMYLGEINGPTEGLLIAISSLLVSGIYGPHFWLQPIVPYIPSALLASLPPVLHQHVATLTFGQTAIYGMIVLLFTLQLPGSIWRVVEACEKKGHSVSEALFNSLTYVFMVVSCAAWIFAPSSTIIPNNVVVFALAWGVAVGRINAFIILNHVTHVEYPSYLFLLFPFALGALLSWVPVIFELTPIFTPERESLYVWSVFFFIAIEYVLWAVKVVEQICHHLNIQCFVIPYKHLLEPSLADIQTPTTPSKPRPSRSPKKIANNAIQVYDDDDLVPQKRTSTRAKKGVSPVKEAVPRPTTPRKKPTHMATPTKKISLMDYELPKRVTRSASKTSKAE